MANDGWRTIELLRGAGQGVAQAVDSASQNVQQKRVMQQRDVQLENQARSNEISAQAKAEQLRMQQAQHQEKMDIEWAKLQQKQTAGVAAKVPEYQGLLVQQGVMLEELNDQLSKASDPEQKKQLEGEIKATQQSVTNTSRALARHYKLLKEAKGHSETVEPPQKMAVTKFVKSQEFKQANPKDPLPPELTLNPAEAMLVEKYFTDPQNPLGLVKAGVASGKSFKDSQKSGADAMKRQEEGYSKITDAISQSTAGGYTPQGFQKSVIEPNLPKTTVDPTSTLGQTDKILGKYK